MQDGVKVLIDSKALFSIIGSEMDWVEDKISARFVFRNPNISEYLFFPLASGVGWGGLMGYSRGTMWLRGELFGWLSLISKHTGTVKSQE